MDKKTGQIIRINDLYKNIKDKRKKKLSHEKNIYPNNYYDFFKFLFLCKRI